MAAQSPASMHPLGRTHFLQQFLEPQSLKSFKLPWRLLLDEDPARVAEQLRAEGLLEASGEIWVCTPAGRVKAEESVHQWKQQRSLAQAAVLEAFHQGDFARAADAYLAFESQQPFPNDVALNPTPVSRQSLYDDLQELFQACPQPELREQVALAWLWSDAPPLSVEGEIARSTVVNLRDLQRFAREGLAQVLVLASEPEGCCVHCLGLHEQVFPVGQAPKLPAAQCAHTPPCRLAYLPDMS